MKFSTYLLILFMSLTVGLLQGFNLSSKNDEQLIVKTTARSKMASQAYVEDTNTVRFITNDISLITDSVIDFNVLVKGFPMGEQVKITNSNPDVAGFDGNLNAEFINSTTGTRIEMKPKGYGRTAITVIPKLSPNLRQSFVIYIDDYDYRYADSVFNASIYPEGGVNFLDPQKPQSDGFPNAHHRFYAKSAHQATRIAELDWEVKTIGTAQFETRVALKPTRDTADIYFSRGGNYVIYLRHKNNKNKAIIDSLLFSVNLASGMTADLKTGFLTSLQDPRDGQIYKLLNVKHQTKERWVSIMEPLRYLPHVTKIAGSLSDWKTSPHVFVFGNDTTNNANIIRPHLGSGKSIVMYNLHMKLDLDEGTDVTGTNHGSRVDIQGICPDGYNIPKSDSLVTYLFRAPGGHSSLRDAKHSAFFAPANFIRSQTYGYTVINTNPIAVHTENNSIPTGVSMHAIHGGGGYEHLFIAADGGTAFEGNERINRANSLICIKYNITH